MYNTISTNPLIKQNHMLCTVLYKQNSEQSNNICQWIEADRWFSPVSSTNKTDRHDRTEILLKVVLKPNPWPSTLCTSLYKPNLS